MEAISPFTSELKFSIMSLGKINPLIAVISWNNNEKLMFKVEFFDLLLDDTIFSPYFIKYHKALYRLYFNNDILIQSLIDFFETFAATAT